MGEKINPERLFDVKGLYMRIILIYSLLMCAVAQAQTIVSLDDALSIAMQNSPQIKQAELNLERSSQSLKAQRAALKSNFSLSINPYSYSYNITRLNCRINLAEWHANSSDKSIMNLSTCRHIKF